MRGGSQGTERGFRQKKGTRPQGTQVQGRAGASGHLYSDRAAEPQRGASRSRTPHPPHPRVYPPGRELRPLDKDKEGWGWELRQSRSL